MARKGLEGKVEQSRRKCNLSCGENIFVTGLHSLFSLEFCRDLSCGTHTQHTTMTVFYPSEYTYNNWAMDNSNV